MIAGCRPGADMIGASAPMWLAACVWTLQYPEFRQFSSSSMSQVYKCDQNFSVWTIYPRFVSHIHWCSTLAWFNQSVKRLQLEQAKSVLLDSRATWPRVRKTQGFRELHAAKRQWCWVCSWQCKKFCKCPSMQLSFAQVFSWQKFYLGLHCSSLLYLNSCIEVR